MTTPRGFVPTPFSPRPGLKNNHAQTAWGALFKRRFAQASDWREADTPWRLVLPDGDTLTGRLHLHPGDPARERPTLLILHGLEGDADADYMSGFSSKAFALGWHSLRLNYRGCGEGEGLARRMYNGLSTGDIDLALRDMMGRVNGPVVLAGVSLGANKLLKLIAGYGEAAPDRLRGAVAVSAPIDFVRANQALGRGFNLVYDHYFLAKLRRKLKNLAVLYADDPTVLARIHTASRARKLGDFDAAFTAPMGGFADAHSYYEAAGSGPEIGSICVPTLLIHAQDDPFIPFSMYTDAADALSANPWITTLYPEAGGHVGFLLPRGKREEAWMDAFWAENIGLQFLRAVLEPVSER